MVFKPNITYRTSVSVDIDKRFKSKIDTWKKTLTDRLSETPGRVKRPIQWTSERQRRAFFATDGFGRGIPTRRTGKVSKWKVYVSYDGIDDVRTFTEKLIGVLANINPFSKSSPLAAPPEGILVNITNPAEYQRFVTGVDQQGFHKNTGWIQTAPIITDSISELDSIVSTGIL